MDALRLSALLCSRLCHDLVSPVGAVNNGLELLAEEQDADMQAQVMDLLDHSAGQTANRLAFFRLAFGAAGGMGDGIELGEVRKTVENYFATSKLSLEWQTDVRHPELDRDSVKLLMNAALVMGEGIIRAGTLSLFLKDRNGTREVTVTAAGDKLKLPDSHRRGLEEGAGAGDIEPRSAPAVLAALMASSLGARLDLNESPKKLTLFASWQTA